MHFLLLFINHKKFSFFNFTKTIYCRVLLVKLNPFINNILQKWIYTPAKLDLEEYKFDLLNKEINDARPPKLLAKEKMRESLGKKHQILLDTLLNIRLFLENGSIKEDGVFDTKTDFINTFQILLKEQPARLKQVILHLTKTQNSVIRILSIFPQKIIAKII